MKLIIAFCLFGIVACRKLPGPKKDPYADFAGDEFLQIPEEDDDKPPTDFRGNVQTAKITNSVNRNKGDKFKYTYETENGISVSQVGKLKDSKTYVVMGSYSYTGANGKRYRVKYTADEKGYHPITELDVDIPDLMPVNLTRTPVKPFTFGSFNDNKNKNAAADKDTANKLNSFDSNYNKDNNLNVNDDVGVKVTDNNNNEYGTNGLNGNNGNNIYGNDGTNGLNGNNNGYNGNTANGGSAQADGYHYDKPQNELQDPVPDRTYLPPATQQEYLPPGQEYLPPASFVPPKVDY